MTIIDSLSAYDTFLEKYKGTKSILVPIFLSDTLHPKINKISIIWIYLFDSNEQYIITVDHSELIYAPENLNQLFDSDNIKFIYNSKAILNLYPNIKNFYDIDIINYLNTTQIVKIPEFKIKSFYSNLYPKYKRINSLIPLSKYFEFFGALQNTILNIIDSVDVNDTTIQYYNDIILRNLAIIESNSLFIDSELKDKYIFNINGSDSDHVYSQYNIFTTTGRPSNRFSNLNFAALNKDSGIRSLFISRYSTGILIEFDYDACHLRIIADLVGIKFGKNESVHNELAKLYFNKTDITEDDYTESKKISFRQLYGGILPEYEHIELFSKTKQLIQKLWLHWKLHGYIESPITKRRLYKKQYVTLNPQKLFNYYIQLLETELNLSKIDKINKMLIANNYDSKLVLYTYDSFLFDFNIDDGKKCYNNIKDILEDNDKFLVHSYIGNNYGTMTEKL